MGRLLLALSLLIMDAGAVLIFIIFLPTVSNKGNSFFDRRVYWDNAWAFFIAMIIISVGIFLAIEAKRLLNKPK